MSKDTFIDKEVANGIKLAYASNERYSITILEPYQDRYAHYRIQIYHKRKNRIVIATTLEEFFDIIAMYDELDKDVKLLK